MNEDDLKALLQQVEEITGEKIDDVAEIGKWPDYETLSFSYLAAARTAFEKSESIEKDFVAIPVLNMLRHSVELGLKAIIETVDLYGKKTSKFEIPEEISNFHESKKLKSGHDLKGLLSLAHAAASIADKTVGFGWYGKEEEKEILYLHELDPTGQGFRYLRDKKDTFLYTEHGFENVQERITRTTAVWQETRQLLAPFQEELYESDE